MVYQGKQISGYEKGVNSTFSIYEYIIGHKWWYCRSLTNILKRNIISMFSGSANLQYLQSHCTNTFLGGLSFITWCYKSKKKVVFVSEFCSVCANVPGYKNCIVHIYGFLQHANSQEPNQQFYFTVILLQDPVESY